MCGVPDVMHCFEIHTGSVQYLVGEDPLCGRPAAQDSGVGAHLAKSWETSIRQALMPVASNASKTDNQTSSLLLYLIEVSTLCQSVHMFYKCFRTVQLRLIQNVIRKLLEFQF
jgi:hypothetical protein